MRANPTAVILKELGRTEIMTRSEAMGLRPANRDAWMVPPIKERPRVVKPENRTLAIDDAFGRSVKYHAERVDAMAANAANGLTPFGKEVVKNVPTDPSMVDGNFLRLVVGVIQSINRRKGKYDAN